MKGIELLISDKETAELQVAAQHVFTQKHIDCILYLKAIAS